MVFALYGMTKILFRVAVCSYEERNNYSYSCPAVRGVFPGARISLSGLVEYPAGNNPLHIILS
jgi:hypothetical protein